MQHWRLSLSDDSWKASPEADQAARALLAGDLVAIPTETVYGLAADATNPVACAKIFEAKGRPQFNPLISHLPSTEDAMSHGVFNADALKLAEAFWPGPLTLVLPKQPTSSICDLATAGLPSVALRVPSGPVMRYLSAKSGKPLAAPSANISGRISPTDAQAVADDLESSLAWLVDAGPCSVGVESTIVACLDETPRLLRPGGITREDLEQVLGKEIAGVAPQADPLAPQAPGMLTSHYAPNARVQLNAVEIPKGTALLSFGSEGLTDRANATVEINLSPSGDLVEAASKLFQSLRALDASNCETILVQKIPSEGLGEAINDRLQRAAAPRD